jgi:hypothetical protein
VSAVANGSGKLWRSIAGLFLSLSLLTYIGYGVWDNWEKIRTYPWEFHPFFLLLSSLLLFLAYGIFYLLWKFLLSAFGEEIPFLPGFRIWFLSQLGKYVPGKVWGMVGRVFLLHERGVGIKAGSLSIGYEVILMTLASLIFTLLTLPFWGAEAVHSFFPVDISQWYFILGGILLLLGILYPGLWGWTGNAVQWITGKTSVKIIPFPKYGWLLGMTGCYVVLWALVGLSFCLFILSLTEVPVSRFPMMAGIFVFSWTAGSIAVFAPAGLGVREGLLVLSLGPLISPEFALVAAVASRIWNTVVEMAGIGIGYWIRK